MSIEISPFKSVLIRLKDLEESSQNREPTMESEPTTAMEVFALNSEVIFNFLPVEVAIFDSSLILKGIKFGGEIQKITGAFRHNHKTVISILRYNDHEHFLFFCRSH